MFNKKTSADCIRGMFETSVRDVLSLRPLCSHVIITAQWAERDMWFLIIGENGEKINASRALSCK